MSGGPATIAHKLDVLRTHCKEVGRDPSEIATIYNFPGAITARPLPRTRADDGRWIGGSPDQWIEELTGAVLDHDAAGFTLFPTGPDPLDTTLKRWSQEIAPAVRAATAQQPARVPSA